MATLPAAEAPRPNPLDGLARLAPWRQLALLVALAGSIAVGVAAALWIQGPRFVALGQTFPSADLPGVSEALDRAGVKYQMEAGGTVLVASDALERAELALAESGLAATTPLTIEKLYGGEGGFTETQEDKRQRLLLAKELDMARTLARIKPIASAKVHLAVPRRTPFQRAGARPSASVMVDLRPGRRLSPTQVESIRQLVAQGVEGMDPDQVVVTDQAGRLLGRVGEEDAARQLEYVRSLEARLLAKIGHILTPVTGPNGFAAEVTAQVDFTTFEAYKVSYDGETPGVRSRSTVEETNGLGLGGVPGALTNQPPPAGTAPEEVAGGAAAPAPGGAGGRRRRSETVNHELDRSTSYNSLAHPTLTHLSASVLLDDRRSVGTDGSVERRAWTPEELDRLEAQIRSAIGYSVERQDVVTVAHTPFATLPVAEPPPAPPLWEQAWLWDVARTVGAGLLALVLLFGVLRPLMRKLVDREIVERQAEGAAQRLESERAADGTGAPARPALEGPSDFQHNLEAVRELIRVDPRRAANVMKEWVDG